MALETIRVAGNVPTTIRLRFKGIARYNIYLYSPAATGDGWTRERVIQSDGNSEDPQHDAYDLPAIAAGQKRLVYVGATIASPIGNETVGVTCELLQAGQGIGNVAESADVGEGAVVVIARVVLEALT